IDQVDAPRGIAQVAGGDFAASLQSLLGHWLDALPHTPLLMAGMVGSANGWVEAPYLHCPIVMDALATGVVPVPGLQASRPVRSVPGLDGTSLPGSYDVMRGEETQIIGAHSLLGTQAPVLLCIPGTHCKGVRVDGNRICGSSTSMTGDAFRAL